MSRQNETWVGNGPVIPYPFPVDFPTTEIDEGPSLCLTVNEDWMPYILGACKILAREETWEADEATRQVLTENAMRLPNLVSDDCTGAERRPNWYLQVEVLFGQINGDIYDNVEYFVDGSGVPHAIYEIVADGVGLVAPDIIISGKLLIDNTDCGGMFDTSDFSDPTGTGHDVITVVTSCLDEVTTETSTTPFSIGPGELKSIHATFGSADITYFVRIEIEGDATCFPA